MRKRRFHRAASAVIALCIALSCVSVFSASGAVNNAPDSHLAAAAEADNFTWDNASVYFLLTDRFKNGNTSNDHSYGRATDAQGNPLSGWESAPGTFHGGDFAGITQTIEDGYFNNLGVNAIWISAPYEQIHGYVDSGKGFAHYSYHGYYVLDYTQTDANFGTAQEFETLVDTAHEHGIRVIIDIVMNHAGYNSVADMETYNFGTLLSGASEYKYKLDDISTVNDHIDFKSSSSDWGRWWGPQWIRSGLPGYSEGNGGSDLTMSLAGLPDFKTESTSKVDIPPLLETKWGQEGRLSSETNELDSYLAKNGKTRTVTNSIAYWLSTWVRDYGVDGFRCDTAKHVDLPSWNTLKTTCVDALKEWRQNNPEKPGANWDEDFWMTGECWDHNVGWGYDGYFTQGGFDSMINFETQGGGMLDKSRIANVYSGYAESINTNDKFNALSYISSHDSTLARGDLIYTGSAFLMLPGGIQIYYGDETNRPLFPGMSFDGNGGSGHSLRSDMNWDSIDANVLAHWQKVGSFRNNHVSVGAGSNTKLNSTNGVAFARSYNKNGINDQIAAVIGCNANTDVTVDVSGIWEDGQYIVNAYDNSSSLVNGGKVTFNSGTNGTILMEKPNGQPLVGIIGNAQFYGTQTVGVSLKDCESAKVSVDGGNKFVVKDGDVFTIGSTGYKNDTIIVSVEAENEKAKSEAVFSFLKLGEQSEQPTTSPDGTTPTTQPVTVTQTSTLSIKSEYGAPYVYAWTGSDNAQLGGWPGTLAQKVSDGTYQVTMPVPADTPFNVVLNNGNGAQCPDITGLYNGAILEIAAENYSVVNKTFSGNPESSGGVIEPYDGSVTVTIEPYDDSAQYYLYAWDDNKNELLGAWPGTKLTQKDENGNYVYTAKGYESINAIVNLGSGAGQTGDITGIKDGSTIQITNAGCTTHKLLEPVIVLSHYETLKKEAREVLAMTSTDYTPESWSAVQSALKNAETYIHLGEGATEDDVLASETESLKLAKSNLVLAAPRLNFAVAGQNIVKGIAVADADVTVTVDSKIYTAKADDVTGVFAVTTDDALNSSSIVKVNASRNGLNSALFSYNMSSGNIDEEIPISPTSPTNPTNPTNPTSPTSPSTKPDDPDPEYTLGDVDGSGSVNIRDVSAIQQHLAKIRILNAAQFKAADVDKDGSVSIQDASQIQMFIAKIITSF